jgi:hypothetical protein
VERLVIVLCHLRRWHPDQDEDLPAGTEYCKLDGSEMETLYLDRYVKRFANLVKDELLLATRLKYTVCTIFDIFIFIYPQIFKDLSV